MTCLSLSAQVGSGQLLTEHLKIIEKEYDCIFSYTDQALFEISIEIPPTLESLKEIIAFLNANTRLNFTFINTKTIAVSKKEKHSVCGFIVDYETGEPIEGATVNVGNNATVSDDEGYFELDAVELEDLISMRHISYKGVNVMVRHFPVKNCLKYQLIPRIEHMSEILIRNYLTRGIQKTVSGELSINYKNFGILPGLIESDVLKTLQALPGIRSTDERVSNLSMRGGAHHENLFLWDGIKMYQTGHFFGLISAFNPHLTRKVLVTKSGSKANLSDGVSGTIQMFTDDVLAKKVSGSFGVNLINADAFIDFPINRNGSVQFSARRSLNDWFETPTYNKYFDNAFQNTEVVNNSENVLNSDDEFSFHDLNLRALYELSENDKLRLNLLIFNNDLLFLENAFVRGREESRQSNVSQSNAAVGINYQRSWSDRLTTEFQAYATAYTLESTNADILNQQRLKQENEVLEESLKLDIKYELANRLFWHGGYHYSETGITNIQDVDNPLFKSTVKEVIRAHGLSSQIELQSKSRKTHLNIGGRLNYLEKFASFFVEPRIRLYQKFNPFVYAELLGEYKHQYTTQIVDFQSDFLGIENRRWLLSNNDDIPVIKSKQLSGGIHFKRNGWLLSGEAFYKEVNGITSQSQGFLNQFQYEKTTGSYRIYGAEFLLNRQIENLSTWLSYSHGINEYSFPALNSSLFPNNLDIAHTLNFGLSYSKNKTKISFGLDWHSGRPTTLPIEGQEVIEDQVNYSAPNSARLAEYMRADISAQFSFDLGKRIKAKAAIAVWNLLDATNETERYFTITDDQLNEVLRQSLGLTPNASLQIYF